MKMYFGHCGYGRYDYVKDQDTNKFSIRHELNLLLFVCVEVT